MAGAGVTFTTSPVSGDIAVPYARFDDRLGNYDIHMFRWHATNVTRWEALVDLRANDRIVSLWPANGKRDELPGNPRLPTSD